MLNQTYQTKETNVLVIGCGGSGLRAAIEVKKAGLDVIILGKRSKFDSHTVLAAGGINAAFGNVDKEDCWEQHFADTYIEGYGIGDPLQIELMVKEAPYSVTEIDNWGAKFEKLKNGKLDQRFFGAHTYRRTCYSGDYTGRSILNSLLNKAESMNIPIFDSQYVFELLVQDNCCKGALSIDIKSSLRTAYLSNSVILCTGGNTKIWERSSSREKENTGDGYYLALKAGCELRDMEMTQFHPSGMVYPNDVAGKLVTEAVRGEGGKLFNNKGERFMINYDRERMELSTRDRVAMANYIEIKEGRGSPNGGVYLDVSHIDKEIILKRLPTIYKQYFDYQNLDISKEPMEVAPTAHYSMGGIVVDPMNHQTSVKGLFAVGEVAGGLHGANRLGGNSLAEILVFGKIAGKASINLSNNQRSLKIDNKIIKRAYKSLNDIQKYKLENCNLLQNQLGKVMWEYCGVLKNEKSLKIGLSKIKEIKKSFSESKIDYSKDLNEIISGLDLIASLYSAEASLLSSLSRKESRGAHQRSDYPKTSENEKCNYFIRRIFTEDKLEVYRKETSPLKINLSKIVENTNSKFNIEKKLLE